MNHLCSEACRAAAVLIVITSLTSAAHAQPAQQRIDAAQRMFNETVLSFEQGMAGAEDVYTWSVRWLEAVCEGDPMQKPAALDAHLQRMGELAQKAGPLVDAGMLPPSTRTACEYYVAEAQFWVSKMKGAGE